MNLNAAAKVAVLVTAVVVVPSGVGAGQDFCGFFDWRDPSHLGDEVWVTVTVEIVNHSGAEVFDMTVALIASADLSEYGELWIGSLPAGSLMRVSGDVPVPEREFELFEKGVAASLRLEYTDSAGDVVRTRMQSVRTPLEDSGS